MRQWPWAPTTSRPASRAASSDRAADVLLVHNHSVGLNAEGVGARACGLDRLGGVRTIQRGLVRLAWARRVCHRDEGKGVAWAHELRGLVHGVLRAAAVVDRTDNPAEAKRRLDWCVGIGPDGDR